MTTLDAGNGTRRRVVVTGMGLVTPLGIGTERNWDALCAGRSGVRAISRFNASNLAVRVAGEVPDFQAERYIERKDLKKMDVFIQYAVAAAQMAVEESGVELPLDRPERTGVIVGVGMGGLESLESAYHHFATQDVRRVSPFFVPKLIPNMASGHIAMRYGARGPNYATTSACASGAHAISDAVLHIRDGRQDVMLAGGAEAPVCLLGVGGFIAMRALATGFNDEPARARPFDPPARASWWPRAPACWCWRWSTRHARPSRRGRRVRCDVRRVSHDATVAGRPGRRRVHGAGTRRRRHRARRGGVHQRPRHRHAVTTRPRRRRSSACSASTPRASRSARRSR